MAWTQRRPSGNWSGLYRDHTGKIRSAGTYSSRERAATEAANKEALTHHRPQQARNLTWGDWIDEWLPTRKLETSSRDTHQARIKTWIRPRWGNVPLQEIVARDIQAWVDSLTARCAPNTVQAIYSILQSSLAAATTAGFIDTNPCTNIAMPADRVSPERFLSTGEVAAIRECLPVEDWFAYDLLLATGMRWGELVGLHWCRVDFDNQALRVDMQYDSRHKTFKPTKGKNTRWIPLADKATHTLEARLGLIGWGKPCEAVYDRVRVQYGPVMLAADGMPPWPGTFRRHLKSAAQKAVIDRNGMKRPVGAVRVHDLRHTYASRLVQGGIDIQTVSAALGHSSLKTTGRYAKIADSKWDAVRQILS